MVVPNANFAIMGFDTQRKLRVMCAERKWFGNSVSMLIEGGRSIAVALTLLRNRPPVNQEAGIFAHKARLISL